MTKVQTLKNELGNYLRNIRMSKGYSLNMVSMKSEMMFGKRQIAKSYVWDIENGRIRDPNVRMLRVLATIYDIEYIELLIRSDYIRGHDLNQYKGSEEYYDDLIQALEAL